MGISGFHKDGKYPVYRTAPAVIDIGGGPSSMLLKADSLTYGAVIDPCEYPEWTVDRYVSAGILVFRDPAEKFQSDLVGQADEVWIYNVLQHVEDPEKIIKNAQAYAPVIRLFEWINIPPHEGHPHMLTSYDLANWLNGHEDGHTEVIEEFGAIGTAFYGVFDTTP